MCNAYNTYYVNNYVLVCYMECQNLFQTKNLNRILFPTIT